MQAPTHYFYPRERTPFLNSNTAPNFNQPPPVLPVQYSHASQIPEASWGTRPSYCQSSGVQHSTSHSEQTMQPLSRESRSNVAETYVPEHHLTDESRPYRTYTSDVRQGVGCGTFTEHPPAPVPDLQFARFESNPEHERSSPNQLRNADDTQTQSSESTSLDLERSSRRPLAGVQPSAHEPSPDTLKQLYVNQCFNPRNSTERGQDGDFTGAETQPEADSSELPGQEVSSLQVRLPSRRPVDEEEEYKNDKVWRKQN